MSHIVQYIVVSNSNETNEQSAFESVIASYCDFNDFKHKVNFRHRQIKRIKKIIIQFNSTEKKSRFI